MIYGPGQLFEAHPTAGFVFNASAMTAWFVALVYLGILWKKYVDGNCEMLTQYFEDLALGKRSFLTPMSIYEKFNLPEMKERKVGPHTG